MFWSHVPVGHYLLPAVQGGEKKTEGGEDVLCNDYFSTTRAATDKRSSPVERVDQVAKG